MNMNKLFLRKIILLGGIALLALIYILQVITGNRSTVRDFIVDKTFDTIEINSSDNGSLLLKRYGDFWKVGDEEADSGKLKLISEAARSLKTLSVISKSSSEDAVERYGFTDGQKITVKVSDNGKEYLTFEIGKDAANGQQNYVRVNGKSEIYLATGALRERFGVTAESLKAPKKEEAPAPETKASEEKGDAEAEEADKAPELL